MTRGRKKSSSSEVAAQPDARAPLEAAAFLAAATPVLSMLEADLLVRARSSPAVLEALRTRHATEQAARRTGEDFDTWTRSYVTQVAAAWLLSCVFVRTLEDRGLLGHARLAGPGATDSEHAFFALAPSLSHREYLWMTFRELEQFAVTRELFDAAHNPVWSLGPSADAARALVALFRTPNADAPSFRFGGAETRFLGDLYQDLSEEVRKRYALLQTPDFVERYILDRTLDRAVAKFGLARTTLIDPTCGSGHFLLGAFARLVDAWRREEPNLEPREAARRALDAIAGADLNPYAVAIARFRLLLAFLEIGGYSRLEGAPAPKMHLAVADSLLHGVSSGQGTLAELGEGSAATWLGDLYALEDEAAARDVLDKRYAAVVGNPPYITMKDAVVREEVRARYPRSAAGKYALAAPFTERFFQLAECGGCVGMINSNSFTKREFGKKLVEEMLPTVNLDGVVNTSDADIPGHTTPTVLLFGTNEPPQRDDVLAVLAKRGESTTPEDAAQGLVWRSIVAHGEEVGFDNEYITVARVARKTLGKHPWSLGGGGAAELKALLEERAESRLGEIATDIGFASFIGLDDAFMFPRTVAETQQFEPAVIKPIVVGETIRDWTLDLPDVALTPYDEKSFAPIAYAPASRWGRWLWRYRSLAEATLSFGGKTRKQSGDNWWEWYRWQPERYAAPFRITFAFVATHNHFVLDRGGRVFKQSAPIIKFPAHATEDDHLALLAYLNSSTACFWMKQVFYPKSTTTGDISTEKGRPEANRYEFAGTGLGALPIPSLDDARRRALVSLAREALSVADHCAHVLESAVKQATHSGSPIDRATLFRRQEEAQARLAAIQEEIDRNVYAAFGLVNDADCAFVEDVNFKRSWGGRRGVFGHSVMTPDEEVEALVATTVTDAIERAIASTSAIQSQARLVAGAAAQTPLTHLHHALAISGDLHGWIAQADPQHDSVPFLAAYRHTESGLEKRGAWERTWGLQRREDAGEAVGAIPVPPKYDSKDYRDANAWRLRGKLDVPKERFISYPGCESDEDGEPLYGWAGWDHLQQAQALAGLYQERKEQGWTRERLAPMLAGLLELLPWLVQWHNEPSEAFGGLKLGEYFDQFVDAECIANGLTRDDLRAWRPTAKRRGGAKSAGGKKSAGKKAKGASEEA